MGLRRVKKAELCASSADKFVCKIFRNNFYFECGVILNVKNLTRNQTALEIQLAHAKCYGSLANKIIHDRYYVLEIHAKMSENLFDVGCGLWGDVMMC